MWEKAGSWMKGIEPQRLFTRMKKKEVNSTGTKGLNWWAPIRSRPRELRTKP